MVSKKTKDLIKRVLPESSLQYYRKLKSRYWDFQNLRKNPRDVFTQIYRKGKWGRRSESEFCSGTGSSDEQIIRPYVEAITNYIGGHYYEEKPVIVDLGCGDFSLGQNFVSLCSSYQGIDIVPDLIESLQAGGFPPHVQFRCLDIIEDALPDGDICFVRQVLQHLSNAQISKILPKLRKYKTVFITEHYPSDNPEIVPNKDIVHGSGIRWYKNSGVYLDKPPFDSTCGRIELLLEAPVSANETGTDSGVVRTYMIGNP